MRQKLLWMLIGVAVAVLCAVGWSNQAQSFPRTPAWEYKVISTYGPAVATPPPAMQKLNDAGAEGWELVDIRTGDSPRAGSSHVRTDYYLKRLK